MTRGDAVASADAWVRWAQRERRAGGQGALFGAPPLPVVRAPDDPAAERAAERRALGHCLASHPCAQARAELRAAGASTLREARAGLRGAGSGGGWGRQPRAVVGATCTRVLEKRTKRGEWMAVLWLEDEAGRCEAVCFPRQWRALWDAVDDAGDGVLVLDVTLDREGDKLVVDGARRLRPPPAVDDSGPPLLDFVCLDVETTDAPPRGSGQSAMPWGGQRAGDKPAPAGHRVVELGAAFFRGGRLSHTVGRLVDPGCPVSAGSRAVHGISDEDLRGQFPFSARALALAAALAGRVVVTYNGRAFDAPVLDAEFAAAGHPFRLPPSRLVDLYDFVRPRYPQRADRPASKRLRDQCAFWGVDPGTSHRAADDAAATGALLLAMQRAGACPRSLTALRRNNKA